jgi:hypothetical protein
MIQSRVINEVLFDNDHLIIIVDGIKYKIKLDDVSMKLKNAEESKRLLYKVSPSGYGIHWPLIDEDLAVEKLIEAATANL